MVTTQKIERKLPIIIFADITGEAWLLLIRFLGLLLGLFLFHNLAIFNKLCLLKQVKLLP